MTYAGSVDPTPLTPAQVRALVAAAGRELCWGLSGVASELRGWRAMATRIPNAIIRTDALDALEHKRTNTDGAAVFSTLLDHRDPDLLALLTAYQAIWDFLDSLSERHPTEQNGRELHLALIDALDTERPRADYYRHHPWRDDGGYLDALVESCRARCRSLSSYALVRRTVVREATRAQVQALNHLPRREDRDAALRRWARDEFADELADADWFELTAAASASLVILPLLALGAKPTLHAREVTLTHAVYWPWVSLATTMLDNYADQGEDIAGGNHNYFTHYPDGDLGVARLSECISRCTRAALDLPDGERHAVIVCSMIAMYLSKDPDGTPRQQRRLLRHAGGSLVRLLVPILRAWRIAYSQRST